MKAGFFFLLLFLLILIVMPGCKKAECKTDSDCLKPNFIGACMDSICVYSPVPGVCGNGLCEAGETKCNCPADCGICVGPSGPFELACVGDLCLELIPESKVKPQISTDEISAGGDKLRITAEFNQPFNMLNDLFNLKISLSSPSDNNAGRRISRIVLLGERNRQVIPLAEKDVNRPLWPGFDINTGLIIDFPTADKSGDITNLELQVTYDYLTGTTAMSSKSVVVKKKYAGVKLNWMKPSTPYPCPEICDDGNPGTLGVCDASTRFFCEHRPVPGACGNYVCDAHENPCTCPADCGPCEGGGRYTFFSCIGTSCVSQLRAGIVKETQSLFDDRKIAVFHLQNNYEYTSPFDVSSDRMKFNFNLYDKNADVSNIKITAIRVFDGSNEIAAIEPGLVLADAGSSGVVELGMPLQAQSEIERSLSIKVWLDYTQAGSEKKTSYSKALGKIALLSPGVIK